jgi:hypothetical protein
MRGRGRCSSSTPVGTRSVQPEPTRRRELASRRTPPHCPYAGNVLLLPSRRLRFAAAHQGEIMAKVAVVTGGNARTLNVLP